MNTYPISIRPFGLHAVLIEWPNEVEETILEDIIRYMGQLKTHLDNEIWELVPAYNSLTLIKQDKPIDFSSFSKQLKRWYEEKPEVLANERFLWRLPVCYDLDFGIDLEDVSNRMQLSIAQIIELHTRPEYIVYGIGFLPGFMYLGGLDASLEVPRRQTPRLKVERGAVGIAARQTGIYPQESPGGWNIIGNCPVPIFDISKTPPCFVKVGDRIQFYAISRAAYQLRTIEGEVGIYQVEKIKLDA